MNDSKISVRYAKALFQTASEQNHADEVMKDMQLLQAGFETPRFKEILESPVIKISRKKKLIEEVFKPEVTRLTFDFLNLLLENKRESFLGAIIRNYLKAFRDQRGIKKADIIVASEISESTRKKFLDILEETFHSGIELEEIIRPSIIGGFILKVEDEQYDASIVSSLAKVKKRLLQTSIEK